VRPFGLGAQITMFQPYTLHVLMYGCSVFFLFTFAFYHVYYHKSVTEGSPYFFLSGLVCNGSLPLSSSFTAQHRGSHTALYLHRTAEDREGDRGTCRVALIELVRTVGPFATFYEKFL